jgi:hypothetical protein
MFHTEIIGMVMLSHHTNFHMSATGCSLIVALKPKNKYRCEFEAFTAVMFQVEIFWVVTPCCVVVGYQDFGEPCCLHLERVYGGSI